jgi:hypothetical protein
MDYSKEWAMAAKRLQDEAKQILPNAYEVTTKEMMMQIGMKYWPHSYAHTDDDEVAINRLLDYCSVYDTTTFLLLGLPDNQLTWSWICRWADCAFPHIVLGHKVASALMSSKASPEILKDMNPPWEAFMVSIPDGIFGTYCPVTQREVSLTNLGIQRSYLKEKNKYVWNWRLWGNESAVQIWQHGLASEKLIEYENVKIENYEDLFDTYPDLKDDRISKLVNRLIVGICLTFPEHNKPIGSGSKMKLTKKKGYIFDSEKKIPVSRSYELRAPIKIDCRDVVKEYIEHGAPRKGSSPTVQSFIAGFYRRPPHGIQKGLPKTVWVHPHVRGPKDAPIAVRSHVVIEK